ncbi:MAG TPA: BsuBI/PstI family type II restriction endonuclease [Thermodesulfovibrionales bacterium]|nr:BsuBI/PstI family type II restriction endonuclease [Thermodesulfovibrionales bacterium]
MTIEEIKAILEKLNFPRRYISEQTAVCIEAMLDETERKGLLPGHKTLSEGARIHDILNFARNVLGKKVAENTREAYRKTSLTPMMSFGLAVRHQLSPRDPNTYYRLHSVFERIFSERDTREQDRLISQLQSTTKMKAEIAKSKLPKECVLVRIGQEQSFSLSPGDHSSLEKAAVEIFSQAFLHEPQVVYLGDANPKKSYQNRRLMRKLNFPINIARSLPDVILFSEQESHLVIVEAVTTSGPVNPIRLEQLQKLTKGPRELGYKVSYISVFPARAVFRKFLEEIAWGSSVWIENEPNNIVHFEKLND